MNNNNLSEVMQSLFKGMDSVLSTKTISCFILNPRFTENKFAEDNKNIIKKILIFISIIHYSLYSQLNYPFEYEKTMLEKYLVYLQIL